MKRYYIHRLGCPKNDVDADYISGFLKTKKMTAVSEPGEADLIIINSCGFIQAAKEESIQAILSLSGLKGKKPGRKIVLTGCLAQRYAPWLKEEMPELDGIIGLNNIEDIADIFNNSNRLVSVDNNPTVYREYQYQRELIKGEPFAYLKISDGCDNRCSYCAIPDIRGHYRSRSINSILSEAAYLIESGKKEIILVSQEVTAYGHDLVTKSGLIPLLDRLSGIDGEFWIRIMYLHPARLTHYLIDYMIDNPRICNYFDIPLQHVNNRLLRLMNRKVKRSEIESLLAYIRKQEKEIAVRTTFIVGFPGETDDDFDELYRFAEEWEFDRMGAFTYSSEEGTRASSMTDQVPEDVCRDRLDQLMLLQQRIAFEKNNNQIGKTLEVLIDSVDLEQGTCLGRTRHDAPDIDQTVRLDSDNFQLGEFVEVKITGCDGYDLLGERRRS